jgi:hypothetical protein
MASEQACPARRQYVGRFFLVPFILNAGSLAPIAKGDGSHIHNLHGVFACKCWPPLVLMLAVRSAEDARSNAMANNRAIAVEIWI